jgi:hypothetical protein
MQFRQYHRAGTAFRFENAEVFSCSCRVMPKPDANNASQVLLQARPGVAKKQRGRKIAAFDAGVDYIA